MRKLFVLVPLLTFSYSFPVLWFESNIKIDNKNIFISSFANKNINFVGQIFHHNGKTKSWDCTKSEDNLKRKLNNPSKIVAFN